MKTSAAILTILTAVTASVTAATLPLSPSGALESLPPIGKLETAAGGFAARDGATGALIDLSKGRVDVQEGRTVFEATGSQGLSLTAEFVPKGDYILVTGTLKNASEGDRAVILDYWVGLKGKDGVFSNSLNKSEESVITKDDAEFEGNAFPIAALQDEDGTVALAIPPLEPRSFGLVGSARGLAIRFYLGISPVTRAFPNQASFSFIVYPSVPDWGFRGALEKYYSFFPDFYKPDLKKVGFFLAVAKGNVPENAGQYAVNTLEIQSPHVKADLDRDDKFGIQSMLYTLVGQREIKFLDKLPEGYDEALQAFEKWTPESHKKFPVTKENVVAGSDAWLKEEVESSAVKDADGKYVVVIRNTPWGKNSVSFKVNPSPYLFADQKVDTVGRNSIRLLDGWLKDYPQIDGVIVDSLGANWPATPNYRRDHFAYAQYPLTFDSKGRLFLHNETSHYEWVKAVNDKLTAQGKNLVANGVYAYRTQALEHFRAIDKKARIKVGRFFISALLDGATSEAGIRGTTERFQDARLMMGGKYCSLTNTGWEQEAKTEEFYNRALAYGVFASNTLKYGASGEYVEGVNEGISYVDNPEGYHRYKKLTDWFLPKATLLNKAGWHPATYARIVSGGEKAYLERFGNGNDVYFTIFNDSDDASEATVKFDFKSLGFTEGSANFQEIGQGIEISAEDADSVKLKLAPRKTYIISVSKTWLWGKAF